VLFYFPKCEKAKVSQQGKVMSESINVENKKQNHQKPPRSLGRIACEILAGTALGLVALRVVYRPVYELFADSFEGILGYLLVYVFIFPPLYGLATAVGVYLVGNIGKQTGSFLATLGWSFLLTLKRLFLQVQR